jgi:beta-N-acetylhexosaminidase
LNALFSPFQAEDSFVRPALLKLVVLFAVVYLRTFGSWAASAVHLDPKGERWATATLHKMSLEERVGQLIMPWARIQFANIRSPDYLKLREDMKKYHVGGFGVTVFVDNGNLLKSQPLEAAALTNGLQKSSKYPLLFAADFERGLAMRLNGATSFPPAMAFGATGNTELTREFGRISAEESRAVGVQWNWFPVADVNSNPANPIINTRSFGEDPVKVGDMVAAYIAGARSAGMLTTVKHFPGHGDTDTDSHLTLARVGASVDRLNSVELVPFRAAIAAGVDSVMIAHITVPSIEPDPNKPASISFKVVTGLLKGQLGFQGLVVTDALDMGALTRVFSGSLAKVSGDEAVAAILAGNDMVIIPADLGSAYRGLLMAVQRGTISRKRLDESALKILRLKASVGLNRDRYVDMASVEEVVARPESVALAQRVSDQAVTLAVDANKLLPLRMPDTAAAGKSGVVAIVLTDSPQYSDGVKAFATELRKRVPDAAVLYVDAANSSYVSQDVMTAVAGASVVIAVAEAVPSARRTVAGQAGGSIGLDSTGAELLADIVKTASNKAILAAFGNPYIGAGIPGIGSYVCTFSNTPDSAQSLVEALFGEIPIHGRLPVSIPGIADRGAGLDRDPVAPTKAAVSE